MKRNEIRIRDPFILLHENQYFLYGSTDDNTWEGEGCGFNMYVSEDLIEFTGPYAVFEKSTDFWGETNFWAPEVYYYKDRFYMFASFKADDKCRGVQILSGSSPYGPFMPLGNKAITPENWECLDGTLYVDKLGVPYLVFCHEWLQVEDGEICAAELSPDFKEIIGECSVLFRASEAKWTRKVSNGKQAGYVSDGPYLYQTEKGDLLMMWSSHGENGYAMGQSISTEGIFGPWKHIESPIFDKDGGHGMLFKSKNDKLTLTIHSPNITGNERPAFLEVREENSIIFEV